MTAPGRDGQAGDTAARRVGEDLTPDSDTATRLSMEGRIVRDETRRAGPATLGAVQWTVSGVVMAAGAPAVNLVEVGILSHIIPNINIGWVQEEPKPEVGPALRLRTEGGRALEKLKTRNTVT